MTDPTSPVGDEQDPGAIAPASSAPGAGAGQTPPVPPAPPTPPANGAPAPQAPPANPYQAPPTQPPANPYQAPPTQPPANPYASTPGAPAAPLNAAEEKQWAMWAHLGGVLSVLALVNGWIALLAIVPALVIFLVYGKRSGFVRQEAKEALNFQITLVGAMIVLAIISTIVFTAFWWALGLSGLWVFSLLFALIGWALVIVDVVFSIIAGVRVNGGGSYRYPFALRLVK